MSYIKLLLAALMVTFFLGCSQEEKALQKETYKQGDTIKLTSIMGSEITLLRKESGFVIKGDEDKIVFVDIFGTFCKPCQEEAPELMNFQLKNSDDLVVIGLSYLEEVTDEYVMENFVSKYNAYYFIVNSDKNKKIVDTITEDIDYNKAVSVPFKVVLKDGKYQNVTDVYEDNPDNKFYIGKVAMDVIQEDIDRIKSK